MNERDSIVGVDPGTKRVGLAVADLETRFAHPLDVIPFSKDVFDDIARIAAERGAVKIVVGKPVGLSGKDGPAVDRQRVFIEKLRAATDVPVEEYDERLTTVVAEAGLRAGGARPEDRKSIRDAVAAQVLLQSFLDSTR